MLKRVGVRCSRIDVCDEDTDCSMSLARVDDDDVLQPMRLYRVRICVAWQYLERFVLADSHDGAQSQATCGLAKALGVALSKADNLPADCFHVERVPFFIRGWSATEF